MQAIFAGEAKGAREATRQLKEQVHALGAVASKSESKMKTFYDALLSLEKGQQGQLSAKTAAKAALQAEEIKSKQKMQASQLAVLGR